MGVTSGAVQSAFGPACPIWPHDGPHRPGLFLKTSKNELLAHIESAASCPGPSIVAPRAWRTPQRFEFPGWVQFIPTLQPSTWMFFSVAVRSARMK